MKYCIQLVFLLFVVQGVASTASEAISSAAPEVSATLPLSDVPAAVVDVAREKIPDAYFRQASWVLEDDFKVYRLAGSYFRKEVAVYVREDGKFLWSEINNRDD